MSKPKKKRTKKHNQKSLDVFASSFALKSCLVVFITGEDYCKVINRFTYKEIEVTPYLYKTLTELSYKWSVYTALLTYNRLLKENGVSGESHHFKQAYRQGDLADYLNEKHAELLDKYNPNLVIGMGWIASPAGVELTQKEAFEIFDKLNGFDRYKDPSTGEIYVTDNKHSFIPPTQCT